MVDKLEKMEGELKNLTQSENWAKAVEMAPRLMAAYQKDNFKEVFLDFGFWCVVCDIRDMTFTVPFTMGSVPIGSWNFKDVASDFWIVDRGTEPMSCGLRNLSRNT